MSGTVATDFYLWGAKEKQSFVNGWVRCLQTLTEALGPVADDTEDADALTRAVWECRYTIYFWAKAWGLALPSELSEVPALQPVPRAADGSTTCIDLKPGVD